MKIGTRSTSLSNKKWIVSSQKKLTIECDEMWSLVGNHNNKQWIWLALDVETQRIVGIHVGSCNREGAQALWDLLPPVYRQCAVCYTDFWEAYVQVIPSKRHHQVGKETRKKNHIERFNCTHAQATSKSFGSQNAIFLKKID